jgi:hypothetical protein
MGTRRVLYALPGEQWRIDAYLLLWKTAKEAGWNEGFERMEGSLLGYEDWENDFHIEQHYRKAKRENPNIQPLCVTAPENGFAPPGRAPRRTTALRIAPVRRVPDDREFAAPAADPTAHAQAHHFTLALPGCHEHGEIQKHVPAAWPTEDVQSIPVFVKRAKGVELDDHAPR